MAATMHDLLTLMIERGASDLHITTGTHPQIRLNGKLTAISVADVKELPAKAKTYAETVNTKATELYTDLTVRGEKLVAAIRKDGVTWVQHSGGLHGFITNICFDPKERVADMDAAGLPVRKGSMMRSVPPGDTTSKKSLTLSPIPPVAASPNVWLSRSRIGLTSAISTERSFPDAASISIASCASR